MFRRGIRTDLFLTSAVLGSLITFGIAYIGLMKYYAISMLGAFIVGFTWLILNNATKEDFIDFTLLVVIYPVLIALVLVKPIFDWFGTQRERRAFEKGMKKLNDDIVRDAIKEVLGKEYPFKVEVFENPDTEVPELIIRIDIEKEKFPLPTQMKNKIRKKIYLATEIPYWLIKIDERPKEWR